MLTSSDLALLIPLVFFALYSTWITAEVLSVREELDVEKRCHEMTTDQLNKEYRLTRTYRKALQFYAEDENWLPDMSHKPPLISKLASDQGNTAQLALGDFFLAPDADLKAPILNLPKGEEGLSLGKYFFLLGPK
jgi:hypothetical protein